MSTAVNGVVYGCSGSLEKRAYGLSEAGRALSEILVAGGTLPATYTIKGTRYAVVKVNVTPNGSTDNQTALNSAYSANRAGVPTILVLPPSPTHYRYSNVLSISANTYLVGYGASVEPLGLTNYAHSIGGNNAGILGLRMVGNHQTLSRWPERHQLDPTIEAPKNGTLANSNGGGVTNDAWVLTSGRSNIIIMDCIAFGSFTGFVRCWGGSSGDTTEHLYEGNVMHRSTSDSIHLTQGSTFMTARRNRIFDSGDDAISVVSYSKVDFPIPPSNILVELNEIDGSRARGLTVVGGLDVLHQDNFVKETVLAPFLYAAASAHSTHNVRAICRRNRIWRGGKRAASHTHNGIAVSTFAYSGASVAATVQNNECNTFGEFYAAGADFVRESAGGGVINITESGNTVRAINAST